MGMIEIAKETELLNSVSDEKVFYLIVRGSIKVSYTGGEFVLKNGDIAGLLEIGQTETILHYETMEKCSVVEYRYSVGDIRSFFMENKDILKYLVSSFFRQLEFISKNYEGLKRGLFTTREYVMTSYEEYEEYCESIGASPSDIADFEECLDISTIELLAEWKKGYHTQMSSILKNSKIVELDPDFLLGTAIATANDARKMVRVSEDILNRKSDIINILLGESGGDLFEIYQILYEKAVKTNGLNSPIVSDIHEKLHDIMITAEQFGVGEEPYYAKRLMSYDEVMNEVGEMANTKEADAAVTPDERASELLDSLNKILNYSTVSDSVKDSFERHIHEYKKTVNKSANDENVQILRKEITSEFYMIYEDCFLKSVQDREIPVYILMLLEFGYVDEALCGEENAVFLSRVAQNMPTDPEKGVYSFRQWLLSIYNGEKDPGRNEFDVDYAEFLREEVHSNRMTKERGKELFLDPVERVRYELSNVLVQVNKMTSGRVTTFCPVLSEHNFLKKIKAMLVSASSLLNALDDIRNIDFSAYYRTTVYSNPECGITREFIDVEVLPDFILTPNVGNRAILWQEIEGRRRTTPARVYISALSQEDIYQQVVKITGNFRWEMCKRIQGGRWNDITEKSLTSEYFDYVQYYRKNNELSAEAKGKVKTELIRSKNSFREMFIRDYAAYIQFESQGSPRLNKVSRGILMNYVPFKADVRAKLLINPMYRQIIERYEIKQKAKAHRMDNLFVKIKNSGNHVPFEIKAQGEFLLK